MASEYDPIQIQKKWANKWRESKVFEAGPDPGKKKFYLTVAFPYPSGSMHVGHGRTYTVPDIIARFKRMQGFNVLFPMAWHVTGSPVLGIAERIKKRDKKTMELYGGLYKVPPEVLETFIEPENIVRHFSTEYHQNMDAMGYSIDWNREFLSITPQYSKFIEWQYKKLHDAGLIKMGEHPVRYCPGCDNPVGDHDLMQGESAEVHTFTVIKFGFGDMFLPAATLRPETLFGVTNMWVNPDLTYVRVKVGSETWVLSKEAAEKIRFFGKEVEIEGEISGSEIVGKSCIDPLTGTEIPILPASFVDPDYATGVVMSVPAHAPYDYIALMDLGSDIPMKVIIGEGTEAPAKKLVEERGITDQKDPKLEEATQALYREEHAKGKMSGDVPADYAGMPVRAARDKVTAELLDTGRGDLFYEFSESPVVCRCGTRCVIKILTDQWFIRYSDAEWKEKAHSCLREMDIVPQELKQNFDYFIDWLKDWACTRRVGLGTIFPYDTKWLIEPLSDSTIYMAYYTISRHLRDIEPSSLVPEFFDYVLLGAGDAGEVSQTTGVSPEKIEEIRSEFAYWYPLDWRLSAKDLVGNHLSFFIFHHTAIFQEEMWPKGIAVFGMGLLEGNKMSSSKGNVILLSDAIEQTGSDVVRLFLMSNAEPWQDFDWREVLVKNTSRKLKQFYDHVSYCAEAKGTEAAERDIDRWLLSRMQDAIEKTTAALEGYQSRKALQSAFFDLMNDFSWYMRRCQPRAETLSEFSRDWTKLMAPFTPFVCEELWEKTGGVGFVSLESYPVVDGSKKSQLVEVKEDTIKKDMEDIQNILTVSKIQPKKIYMYLAPEWKRAVFEAIREGKTIKDVMADPDMRRYGKDIPQIMQKNRKEELPAVILSLDEEEKTLLDAKDFLEKEFGAEVDIQKDASYDPDNKARFAMPMRPGIYIE